MAWKRRMTRTRNTVREEERPSLSRRATSLMATLVLLHQPANIVAFSSLRGAIGLSTGDRHHILSSSTARRSHWQSTSGSLQQSRMSSEESEEEQPATSVEKSPSKNAAPSSSKRQMLTFAIPALGIFLANPLLSNIDNAFVGRTAGTAGLAALSPATICTDQMIYLFSFLGRATTGIVSRAYAQPIEGANGDEGGGNVDAAREAASAPLTIALLCGVILSGVYAFYTPHMLNILNVDPALRTASMSYIYWRGAVSWATLAQAVSLSTLLATRDAWTPLTIVALAAGINMIGDAALCVWPLQWGCAGAAAATAGATLVSSGFMVRVLWRKKLLPRIRIPSRPELKGLLEYTGPLLAITLTRLAGFLAMQRAAMKLGVESLAAYQLCINCMVFFLLFGEPLSQLCQTQLPALIDAKDGKSILGTLKSVLTLAGWTSMGVGILPFLFLTFGSTIFSSDAAVQLLTKQTAPSVFIAVATAIMTVTIDGAMLASRDFGFILCFGMTTCLVQLQLLPHATTLTSIFGTFTLRLGSYALAAVVRTALGRGNLGRIIRSSRHSSRPKTDDNGDTPEIM